MPKSHDLAVSVGSYTDKDGKEKKRYENVGAVITKDDGGMFILLKRTFNPAGVPGEATSDSVLLSMFSVGEREQQQPQQRSGGGQPQRQQAPASFNDFKDDIPF